MYISVDIIKEQTNKRTKTKEQIKPTCSEGSFLASSPKVGRALASSLLPLQQSSWLEDFESKVHSPATL
jgi:hypothetical protein